MGLKHAMTETQAIMMAVKAIVKPWKLTIIHQTAAKRFSEQAFIHEK